MSGSDPIALALIGIIGSFLALTSWVVRNIFKIAEEHTKVVQNNTTSLQLIAKQSKDQFESALPAIKLQQNILDTQKQMIDNQLVFQATQQQCIETQKQILAFIKEIKEVKL